MTRYLPGTEWPGSALLGTNGNAEGLQQLRVTGWLGEGRQHRMWWPAEDPVDPPLHTPGHGAAFVTWDWTSVRWHTYLPAYSSAHEFLGMQGEAPTSHAGPEEREQQLEAAREAASRALVWLLEDYPDGRCPACGEPRGWRAGGVGGMACMVARGAVFRDGYGVSGPTVVPPPRPFPALLEWVPAWVREIPSVLPVGPLEVYEDAAGPGIRMPWLRGPAAKSPERWPALSVSRMRPGTPAWESGRRWVFHANTATITATGSSGGGGPVPTFLEAVERAGEALLLRGSNLGKR